MNLKKGDKVRFLNDVGGGIVISIIDQKKVMILNEDDFEIPVLANELVKVSNIESHVFEVEDDEHEPTNYSVQDEDEDEDDQDEEEWEEEDDYTPTESIEYIDGNDELKLYLAMLPIGAEKITDSAMDLYLINDSNFQAQGMAFEMDDDEAQIIWNAHLESNSKLRIKTYRRDELGVFPKIKFQFLIYSFGKFASQSPIEKLVSIQPLKFYKASSFIENDFFEEDALIIPLNDADIEAELDRISNEDFLKLKQQKAQSEHFSNTLQQKFSVKKSDSPIVEVDLHIHELIDNFQGLSNAEMLNIQMEKFHTELASGLKNNEVKKMVFIHGVGAGTLKQELRTSLNKDYPQLYFQDASFKEYGFGATLIIIRRG